MSEASANPAPDSSADSEMGAEARAVDERQWKNAERQAYFWRGFTLLQIVSTALAIVVGLGFYFAADTVVQVPTPRDVGFTEVSELPDTEFIDHAVSLVNLIATYQPAVARRQFKTARDYLWEPALTKFEEEMIGSELQSIEQTRRSQRFDINPRGISVRRTKENQVQVFIPGIREKFVSNRPLPYDRLMFVVTMTTLPKKVENKYGIVVTEIDRRTPGQNA